MLADLENIRERLAKAMWAGDMDGVNPRLIDATWAEVPPTVKDRLLGYARVAVELLGGKDNPSG